MAGIGRKGAVPPHLQSKGFQPLTFSLVSFSPSCLERAPTFALSVPGAVRVCATVPSVAVPPNGVRIVRQRRPCAHQLHPAEPASPLPRALAAARRLLGVRRASRASRRGMVQEPSAGASLAPPVATGSPLAPPPSCTAVLRPSLHWPFFELSGPRGGVGERLRLSLRPRAQHIAACFGAPPPHRQQCRRQRCRRPAERPDGPVKRGAQR